MFADAFDSINYKLAIDGKVDMVGYNDGHDNWYEAYLQEYVKAWQASFLVSLGEFSSNFELYGDADWLVFFLYVFMNIILLFNLLIAIISESFNRIFADKETFGYKEKCFMMSQM